MRKLSEINEGMFSGMVRRANTDQVKKEDDVNHMDMNDFFHYIISKYELNTTSQQNNNLSIHHRAHGYQNICYIYVPFNEKVNDFPTKNGMSIYYDDDLMKISTISIGSIIKNYPELLNKLNELYKTVGTEYFYSIMDSDKLRNSDILNILDIIIQYMGNDTIIVKK